MKIIATQMNAPHLSWGVKDGKKVPNYTERLNRQYLSPCYIVTGAFVISKASVVTEKTRIGAKVDVFEVPERESQDVDTFSDPRDLAYDYYREFTVDRGTDMWELTILGKKADKMVLIAGYSSAQINPKLLFHLEPTLIFVYKFNNQLVDETRQRTQDMIEDIRKTYKKPDRIHVPTTEKELTTILKKVIY